VVTAVSDVMLKQTTSLWTATAILDEKALLVGLEKFMKNPKATRKEIENYTGALYKREQGLSTTELGERAERKRLAGTANIVNKAIVNYAPQLKNVPEGIRPSNWLQSMDCTVAAALWEATKAHVEMNGISPDGNIYWDAVTNLYDKVIEETQSNYDIMHRPEILKNNNELVKAVTMFQTDSLQQTGILINAVGNYNSKKKKFDSLKNSDDIQLKEKAENDLKAARKRLRKAISSIVVSAAWLALAKLAGDILFRKFKPLRDEEKNDITSESIAKAYMSSFAESIVSVVPIIGPHIFSLYDSLTKGYDFIEAPAFSVIADLITATSNLYQALSDENTSAEKVEKAFMKAVPAIGNSTGLPLNNIISWFTAAKGYIGDIKASDFAHDISDYAGAIPVYSHADLAASIMSGDKKQWEKIRNYYKNNNKDINQGSLTSAIKEAYVKTFVDSPEKAKAIEKILVLEFNYNDMDGTKNRFETWVFDEYFKYLCDESPKKQAYAEEIFEAAKSSKFKTFSSNLNMQKEIKSRYQNFIKSGENEKANIVKKTFLDKYDCFSSNFDNWNKEVEDNITDSEKELEEAKERYRE